MARSWPRAIRRRASELADAGGLTRREIAETLSAELGAEIPAQTVNGWITRDRLKRPPEDVAAALDRAAGRSVALIERELTALERGRGSVDLIRLERLTRALSMLRRDGRQSPKGQTTNGRRTLADLDHTKADETEPEI